MRADCVAPILATWLLAGCAGAGSDGSGPSDGLQQGDANVLRGVVVDDGLRTLAQTTVVVLGTSLRTTSGEDGTFSFGAMTAGTYIVIANRSGYLPAQAVATVVDGQPAEVRLQLHADLSPAPYHRTEVTLDGFMEVWGGLAQFLVGQVLNGTAACTCAAWFTPDLPLRTLVFEAYWEPKLPEPTGGQYYFRFEEVGGTMTHGGYCQSPCINAFDPVAEGYTPGHELKVSLSGPDIGIAFEQDFDLFVTAFYNEPAPGGWTLKDDGP